MRNISFIVYIVLVAGYTLFSACQRESFDEKGGGKEEKLVRITFNAFSGDKESDTKTTIDSLFIKWVENDSIGVFDGTPSQRIFRLTAGAGSNSGTFSGAAVLSEKYFALYPYSSSATISDTVISDIVLPSAQTVTEGGSVDPNATVMVAQTADTADLRFRNVLSYIKVRAKQNCTKIVVKGNDGEVLAGTFKVHVCDKPSFSDISNPAYKIELTGSFVAEQNYYIGLLPQTFSKGITIDFYTADARYQSKRNSDIELEAGKIYNGGSGNDTLSVNWTQGLGLSESDIIARNLSERWDDVEIDGVDTNLLSAAKQFGIKTNCSGEGEYGEVMRYLNGNNTLWLEYDGTAGAEKLYVCTSVSKIIVTGGSGGVGAGIFSWADELESFSVNDKLDWTQCSSLNYAFYHCSALDSIDLSSVDVGNVTSVRYLFANCESLDSVYLANWNTSNILNMSGMFKGCSDMAILDLSKLNFTGVTNVSEMFRGCSNLESLTLNDGLNPFNFKNNKSDMFTGCGKSSGCVVKGVSATDLKSELQSGTGWGSNMSFE